jgi:hypothetical protein
MLGRPEKGGPFLLLLGIVFDVYTFFLNVELEDLSNAFPARGADLLREFSEGGRHVDVVADHCPEFGVFSGTTTTLRNRNVGCFAHDRLMYW